MAETTMDYGSMRLRWCALALRAFVARWAVLILVTAAVVGAGSNGPVQAVGAVAAWLVLPLCRAATHGAWLAPAWLAQVLVGAGLVWGVRALLWPAQWREAELALPLPRGQTLRSDALVVALALLPLAVSYAAGLLSLLASGAPWLRGHRALAVAALATAVVASGALGVSLLQRQRRLRFAPPARPPSRASMLLTAWRGGGVHAPWAGTGAAHWSRALLWLPLWRGPARRSGQALVLFSLVLCAPAAGLAWRPDWAPWWLSAWAVLSLLATTRVAALLRLEMADLHAACAPLPVPPTQLQRGRQLMPLAALMPGLLALGVAAAWAAACCGLQPRLPVLAAYVLVCIAGCSIESFSPSGDAASKASRWLLTLALCIALASEATR